MHEWPAGIKAHESTAPGEVQEHSQPARCSSMWRCHSQHLTTTRQNLVQSRRDGRRTTNKQTNNVKGKVMACTARTLMSRHSFCRHRCTTTSPSDMIVMDPWVKYGLDGPPMVTGSCPQPQAYNACACVRPQTYLQGACACAARHVPHAHGVVPTATGQLAAVRAEAT